MEGTMVVRRERRRRRHKRWPHILSLGVYKATSEAGKSASRDAGYQARAGSNSKQQLSSTHDFCLEYIKNPGPSLISSQHLKWLFILLSGSEIRGHRCTTDVQYSYLYHPPDGCRWVISPRSSGSMPPLNQVPRLFIALDRPFATCLRPARSAAAPSSFICSACMAVCDEEAK